MPVSDDWVRAEFELIGVRDPEISPLMRMTMAQMLEAGANRLDIIRAFKGPWRND